jgi:uncharacterized protein (UPF0335 family)
MEAKNRTISVVIIFEEAKKVFDRNEQSWHELNPVAEQNAEVYKDAYSAKYLNKVYYPAFKLRVKENNKPEVKFRCTMIGEDVRHKYGKKWTF